jgi:hypothetical protein
MATAAVIWAAFLRLLTEVVVPLGWPLVVFGAVILFRKPIDFLLRHGRFAVNKDGVEVSGPLQEQMPPPSTDTSLSSGPANPDPILDEQEGIISAHLPDAEAKFKLTRETILVKSLAEATVALHFERVYQVVWGSQIALLRNLNERGGNADDGILKHYYDAGQAAFPARYSDYTLQSWTAFLTGTKLIAVSDKAVNLTLPGKRFLQYLIDRGYSYGKDG